MPKEKVYASFPLASFFVLIKKRGSYNKTMKDNNRLQDLSSPKPSQPSVALTATIVTALSVAERFLGFLYRMVLSHFIGAEGVGVYQISLSLFAVFLTIGTGGIPITVSRLIAKSKAQGSAKGERAALSAGMLCTLIITLPVAILLGLFADKLPFLFTDMRCVESFRILLCGLVFSCVYAVVRGFFWGNDNLLIPSILEIAEESVMVLCGVFLLQTATSPLDGANKAALSATLSYLFSFGVSIILLFVKGGRLSSPKRALKPLISAAAPVTGVRMGNSFIQSAVAVLLPAALVRAGMSQSEALGVYGAISGMALPVLFIPATIIGSLALVLAPKLSKAYYQKDKKTLYSHLQKGIKTSLVTCCFLLPFFSVFGREIGLLCFAEPLAGEYIRSASPLLLPMGVAMITTSMLNAVGKEKHTFLYNFIGAAALLICVLFLPPLLGGYAYLLGMGVNFFLGALCNLILLCKTCPKLLSFPSLKGELKALILLFPLSLVGEWIYLLFGRFLGAWSALILSGIILALLSVLSYLIFGVIRVQSVFLRKKGKKERPPA
jgi:stage V sporulation protein B